MHGFKWNTWVQSARICGIFVICSTWLLRAIMFLFSRLEPCFRCDCATFECYLTAGRWRACALCSFEQIYPWWRVMSCAPSDDSSCNPLSAPVIYGFGVLNPCRRILADNPLGSVKKFPRVIWKPADPSGRAVLMT